MRTLIVLKYIKNFPRETEKRKDRKNIKILINCNIWMVSVGTPVIRVTTTDGKKKENCKLVTLQSRKYLAAIAKRLLLGILRL